MLHRQILRTPSLGRSRPLSTERGIPIHSLPWLSEHDAPCCTTALNNCSWSFFVILRIWKVLVDQIWIFCATQVCNGQRSSAFITNDVTTQTVFLKRLKEVRKFRPRTLSVKGILFVLSSCSGFPRVSRSTPPTGTKPFFHFSLVVEMHSFWFFIARLCSRIKKASRHCFHFYAPIQCTACENLFQRGFFVDVYLVNKLRPIFTI